jgi:uncharacterized lipoprotein YmbA
MNIQLFIPALLVILTGCSALQPVKDLAVHHVLEAMVPERTLSAETPAIAVKRISIPGYLDRLQLATRADGELVLSELDLWGEPLDAAIARVIATNLSRLTGSMNIQPVQNFTTLDYTMLLELKVAEFEADTANQMILQGTWKLQPVNGNESRTRFFRIQVPIAATPDAMRARVAAMNQALERLASQIAKVM